MSSLNGRAPKSIRLVVPASHSDVRLVRNLLRRMARMEGVAANEIDTLALVASELLANAVDHGGGGGAMRAHDLDADVRMTVSFELDAERWLLRVDDQGGGDLEQARSWVSEQGLPDLEDERGRGLFLMKEMVDELSADRSEDGAGLALIAVRRHDGG